MIPLNKSNGVQQDLVDIRTNVIGHQKGLDACRFWNKVIQDQPFESDSLFANYIRLTRDFVSIQNRSGYETLKSRGLELIEDDELRFNIISLYEFYFQILGKLEEEYAESQFHSSFFPSFNEIISRDLQFDQAGNIIGISVPLNITEAEKKRLQSIILKISFNRNFLLDNYRQLEARIQQLIDQIELILQS